MGMEAVSVSPHVSSSELLKEFR